MPFLTLRQYLSRLCLKVASALESDSFTLSEFVATRRWATDDEVFALGLDGSALCYTNLRYYIEANIHSPQEGIWLLQLDRDSWVSNDLAQLEWMLYRYALSAGCDRSHIQIQTQKG